jgi:hypothetical protein
MLRKIPVESPGPKSTEVFLLGRNRALSCERGSNESLDVASTWERGPASWPLYYRLPAAISQVGVGERYPRWVVWSSEYSVLVGDVQLGGKTQGYVYEGPETLSWISPVPACNKCWRMVSGRPWKASAHFIALPVLQPSMRNNSGESYMR